MEVSRGLSAQLVAVSKERVRHAGGEKSDWGYRTQSDGAGIVPPDPEDPLGDKYVYASNSERGTGNRGDLRNLLRQGRRRDGVQGAAAGDQQ